jgi:IS30 family transposase
MNKQKSKKKTKKKYGHLTKQERLEIAILHQRGYGPTEIGKSISRDKGTISRELSRNRRKIKAKGGSKDGPYEARTANAKAILRRRNSKHQGKKIWLNKPLKQYIISKLRKGWGPDVISGRMKKDKEPFYASKTAIYEFIYSSYGQGLAKYLPSKRPNKKRGKNKKTKRELIPNRVGIEYRPQGIENEYGHYEGDTIVSGKKHHSKKALSVICEKQAKYVDIRKIPSLKPAENNKAVKSMFAKLQNVKTETLDNGLENTRYEEIQQEVGMDIYFCDPYSSWQKASIENMNKLIRRDIPKGSDIADYSNKYIENICKKLNNTPRKSLGYKTPTEVMIENDLLKVESRQMLQFEAIKNTSSVALGG